MKHTDYGTAEQAFALIAILILGAVLIAKAWS